MSLDDSVAFLTERAKATIDKKAETQQRARERIENALISPEGYDDFLEEMAGVDDETKVQYMIFMARATRGGADSMYAMNDAAKQRVIARRLAAGE